MSSGHQTAHDWDHDRTATRETLFADAETVLHDMQEIVGRKWHPILLYYLLTEEPLRFSTLKTRVDGISSKMLSTSLSDLEASGLITRKRVGDKPGHVEYTLTERGASLEGVITEMVQWGTEHGGAER